MTRRDTADRFRNVIQSPATYLAYRGLRHALKEAGQPLHFKSRGFVIFVIPGGYRTYDYEIAAHALIGVDGNEWGLHPHRIRLASPPRRKGKPQEQVTVFDTKDLAILIARNIAEVPKDVRFAALAVMIVELPSARHIHAARRFAGRLPISEEHAHLLGRKPQNILLAALLRGELGRMEIDALEELEHPEAEGPSLFDLPGYEEAKRWAQGLHSDVERWRGGKLPWREVGCGAVISGPPGTGKTLFASALANALGLRLISTTIGEWQSSGALDDTLMAMRNCFESASDGRGAVLFIDEVDSVGRRTSRPTGDRNNHYWQVVVNEFLSQLTNLGEGVIVIGASNFPDWIDPAVLRAGRLEHHFTLPLPDKVTRAEILYYHVDGSLPLESLAEIVEDLEGKSGAALGKLARDARKSARDEDRELELSDLKAQLPERIRYSLEEVFRLAVHEAGHALVSLAVGYATSATIEIKDSFDPMAPGYLGGVTSYELTQDNLPTETSLRNRIAVGLAGMAAEATVFGDRSAGSGGLMGSDIERASSIARRMVGSYGLGSTPIFVGTVEDLSETLLPAHLEKQVIDIVGGQYDRVLAMLKEQRDRLIGLATDAVNHRNVRVERGDAADA